MNTIGVGIDTARYGHRVTFLDEARQPAAPSLTVQETQQGYRCLADTLRQLQSKFPQATLHVRIDAAGHYAANLESFLRKAASAATDFRRPAEAEQGLSTSPFSQTEVR